MEIFLVEKTASPDKPCDKVNVKHSYGRNYLIPTGKVVTATAAKLAEFERRRAELEKKQAEVSASTQANPEAMNSVAGINAQESKDESYLSQKTADIDPSVISIKSWEIGLSFPTPNQRDEAMAVLQHLPELQDALRQRSIASTLNVLMDKPEIYHHDSLTWHLLQNARLRNQFMSEIGGLTREEVAELGLAQTENSLFAVEFQGQDRYPAFQFDPQTGQPRPVIRQMLEVVKDQWTNWQLALWCVSANDWLNGKAPLECLDEAPEKVLEALSKEAGEVEF